MLYWQDNVITSRLEGDRMVTNTTSISFDTSDIVYVLPDELMIDPNLINDEHTGVYRVSLGRANLTPDERAAYKPLFDALDKRLERSKFVSGMSFDNIDSRLVFDIAYVYKRITTYGPIYDIEASYDEITYMEREKHAV